MTQTGGGAGSGKCLTACEERLLKIMGKKAIEGDSNIKELGFPITLTKTNEVG